MEIKLKEIRVAHKKNQEEIATLLNISRSSYAIWENGIEAIPIKRLVEFCELFDISLHYVIGLNMEQKTIVNSFNLEVFKIRFKEFRKSVNLTQEKLATILNTNKSVICNYEKGRNIIPTIFLITICQKYGISADYLLGHIDTPMYFNK